VAADRFAQFSSLLDNQIGHGNHVAQFTQLAHGFGFVVELLGLLEDNRQTAHGPFEREVRAHDTDVVRHNGLHLTFRLDKHQHLLGMLRALEVPVGNALLEGGFLESLKSMARCLIGIDHRLDQRV